MHIATAAIAITVVCGLLAACAHDDSKRGAPEASDNGGSADPGGDNGNYSSGEEPADDGDDGIGNGTDDDDVVSKPNDGNFTGPTPGLEPVLELPRLQVARGYEITERSDTIMMTTMHGESDLPGYLNFTIQYQCSGSECEYFDFATGQTETDSVEETLILGHDEDASGLGSKHGVNLIQMGSEYYDAPEDETLVSMEWGAWMEDAGFHVELYVFDTPRLSGKWRRAQAVGDLTGSAPTGSAMWKGLMVATPTAAADHGTRIFGDATLDYELSGTLDVTFSGLSNFDGGAFHTANIEFHDLQVDSKGIFKRGQPGNQIHGGFFGPNHAEAAGTFEKMNLLGAFGAKKQ